MALPAGNQSRAGCGRQPSGEEAHQAKPKGHEQRCRVGPRHVPQDSGANRRHSHTEAVAHVLPTVTNAPVSADVKMSEIAEVELTHQDFQVRACMIPSVNTVYPRSSQCSRLSLIPAVCSNCQPTKSKAPGTFSQLHPSCWDLDQAALLAGVLAGQELGKPGYPDVGAVP